MSETVSASITIGGNLQARYLPDLLKAIDADGASYDGEGWTRFEKEELLEILQPGEPLYLMNQSTAGHEFEALAAFCRSHSLSYEIFRVTDFNVDGLLIFWTPGMDKPMSQLSTSEGEPVLTINQLKEYAAQQLSAATIVARMEAQSIAIPPFIINTPKDVSTDSSI